MATATAPPPTAACGSAVAGSAADDCASAAAVVVLAASLGCYHCTVPDGRREVLGPQDSEVTQRHRTPIGPSFAKAALMIAIAGEPTQYISSGAGGTHVLYGHSLADPPFECRAHFSGALLQALFRATSVRRRRRRTVGAVPALTGPIAGGTLCPPPTPEGLRSGVASHPRAHLRAAQEARLGVAKRGRQECQKPMARCTCMASRGMH